MLCHQDPINAPCRHLLDQSRREELAGQVNAAILGYPRSYLEDAVMGAVMKIYNERRKEFEIKQPLQVSLDGMSAIDMIMSTL